MKKIGPAATVTGIAKSWPRSMRRALSRPPQIDPSATTSFHQAVAVPPPETGGIRGSRSRRRLADMALAIVEMPAPFSGVLESDRAQLIDAALQAQHGDAMKELTELERAAAAARTPS